MELQRFERSGGEGDESIAEGEISREEDDGPPSRDRLLEAVNNRRRRYTIHYLQRYGGTEPVHLSEVSRQVAAWEQGIEQNAISYADRKNVHTSLYQFHAPKLADIGLINYDRRESTVQLTACGKNLRLDLDVTPNHRRVPPYVTTLSGISVVVALVSVTNVPLLGSVPDAAWTILVTALFVGSTLLLLSHDRGAEQVVSQHPPEPVTK